MTYPPKEARAVSDTSKAAHYPDAHFHPYADDEISLVDLAKILIRRRWWVIGVAGVIFIMALLFALSQRGGDKKYEYVTIYHLAEKEPGRALVTPATQVEQINSVYWPQYRRHYMQQQQLERMQDLPFDLSVTQPANTLLLILRSEALAGDYDEVDTLHAHLIEQIHGFQQQRFTSQVDRLERQIQRARELLTQAEQLESDRAAETVVAMRERLFGLEDELSMMTAGRVLQSAAQGERVTSRRVGGSLILALGLVLGGILGIMAAFFAEFGARVRQSLKEDQQV